MLRPRPRLRPAALVVAVLAGLFALVGPLSAPAGAQVLPPSPPEPSGDSATAGGEPSVSQPTVADPGGDEGGGSATLTVDFGDGQEPSQSVVIIIALTLLSLAPALLMMLTSFTRIVIVLSLTRNALGLQNVPPNQVIVGLSLFLSLFVMGPTLTEVNELAIQPLLEGEIDYQEAYDVGIEPMRTFMLRQVDRSELQLFLTSAGAERPEGPDDIPLTSLVPAFILSELKAAFIIGFVVFIPFLVIDLVVSSSLMSMGMMMLPPILVSLPFKLLLFVLVDGWELIVTSLLTSFH